MALAVPAFSASLSPRLVLQIKVDQLRGELPARYRDRRGEGGFRYLMEHGTWYNLYLKECEFRFNIRGQDF